MRLPQEDTVDQTTIDELFDGPLVTAVPSGTLVEKSPGDGDGEDKGDYCSVQR
ncbi:hypothetical protein KGQ19_01315 [Catenulispora sp. NL8]|uniref:Albusnodin family lasso peptide n=1 Tax=Catenulispora pinistramenti TaxID=2705254 RepID=A0ABS5KGW4_9ACTN|nr:hypothetical protein [Catenulispora pinistramenti]MBS2545499.1 hypothetical protein [Catenulispora pinistramenti]